jgi:predicted nucleotidyltransferase
MVTNQRPMPVRIPSGLASALFTSTQQKVLGLLFAQPNRSFFASEIIQLAQGGSGAVQRELARLEAVGLLSIMWVGNQKHYKANSASPLFHELVSIFIKTIGLLDPLKDAFAPIAQQVSAAFIYGSIADQMEASHSDIDVMVLSESLSYADVYAALEKVELTLARKISPTVQRYTDWRKKVNSQHAFSTKLLSKPKLFIVGSEASLE